jgi:hypothetical protein
MASPIYADGVTDISIVGTTARIRFHVLEADPAAPRNSPKPTHAFTVAMPVESLAQLSESLPKLVQQLLDSGRLKKREAAPTTTN